MNGENSVEIARLISRIYVHLVQERWDKELVEALVLKDCVDHFLVVRQKLQRVKCLLHYRLARQLWVPHFQELVDVRHITLNLLQIVALLLHYEDFPNNLVRILCVRKWNLNPESILSDRTFPEAAAKKNRFDEREEVLALL